MEATSSRKALLAFAGLSLVFFSPPLGADPFDIVLSEIHYNPVDGPQGEFLELYHAGTRPQPLDGWRFTEGISFTFPEGTVMFPGDYLCIALDAGYLRAAAGLPLGDRHVVGNFSGRLSDGGERIRLRTADGMTVFQTSYGDEDPWPEATDGLGPSLEMRSVLDDVDLPGSWAESRVVGGTPARANSVGVVIRRHTLIPEGDGWRYAKGTGEPPGAPLAWTAADYGDSSWPSGPAGIGVGDGDDLTELSDMPGRYSTVYLRHRFDLPDPVLAGRLRLSVTYQDGFVAYLNGHEAARRGLGGSGPVPFDALADAPAEPLVEVFDLSTLAGWVLPAGNVLAVQVANDRLDDPHVTISPELFGVEEEEAEEPVALPLSVNEVKGGAGGFVEVFNRSADPVEVAGLTLIDYPQKSSAALTGGPIAGGGRILVSAAAFTGPPPPEIGGGVLALVRAGAFPGAPVLVDVLKYRLPLGTGPGYSYGRWPDGGDEGYVLSAPSPLLPNQVSLHGEVVIDEIHYHPPSVSGADLPLEFVEIYNRSDGDVDLTGWRFSRGIPFDFAPETKIPRKGYLVLAPDPAAVMAHYGIAGVLGGFDGGLKNSAEVLRLEDALGNPADRVRYADDGSWPSGSDGTGRTIELRSPSLDNALGQSWATSAAGEGTPGGPNSVLEADARPALGELDHRPSIPTSSEGVWVTAIASDDRPGLAVTLRYKLETDGSFAAVAMQDDGLHKDGLAGDGLYGAMIPPEPANSIVQFYLEAADSGGKTAIHPASAPTSVPLYIVSDAAESGVLPRFQVVMTRADRQQFESKCNESVDYNFDCTLIHAGRVYYDATVRFRGHSSRCQNPRSYHIELSHERPFEGVTDLVLNGRLIWNQRMCWDLFRRVGLPYCRNQLVSISFNESDLGLRLRLEHLDDEFIAYHFPGREGGNLYRGVEYQADFTYHADLGWYPAYYTKENNSEDRDYSEVRVLCDAFTNTAGADFAARLSGLIDVPEWIQFFAAENVLSNDEGGIWNYTGDDFFIYHMPATDTEPALWTIIPWDFDDSFHNTQEAVPVCTLPRPLRLIGDPTLGGPGYFRAVRSIAAGQYRPAVMNARIDTLSGLFPNVVAPMKSFVASRSAWILQRFSPEFTAEVRPGEILPRGSEWRFWKGTQLPPGSLGEWTTLGYDHSGWDVGQAGFGYSDGDDKTILSDMQQVLPDRPGYSVVFIRKIFQIADSSSIASLSLLVNYDDGFVAYLNGELVERGNYTGPVPVPLNATTVEHEQGKVETFDLSGHLDLLHPGDNVIAIVGVNRAIDSGDFSLDPWLVTTQGLTRGCGETIYTGATEGTLSGKLPLLEVAFVTVNGLPAEVNLPAGTWSSFASFDASENRFLVEAFGPFGEPLDVLDVGVFRIGAETPVSGDISSDRTWSAAGSPYVVTGDVQVTSGATLTIEPSVAVLLSKAATLVVRGRLLAEGTPGEPIRFARTSCADPWGGLAVIGAGAFARISNALFEHSGAATDGANTRGGALAVVDGGIDLSDSRFEDLAATAVSVVRGSGSISRNLFARTPGAISVDGSRVRISGNQVDSTTGESDAIVVVGGAAGDGAVEGNRVSDAGRHGIVLDGSLYPVIGNAVTGSLQKGIVLVNGASPLLQRDVLYFCDTGLSLGAGSSPVLDHLTLAYNSAGIESAGASVVANSILWGNFLLSEGSGAEMLGFHHCDVDPEDLPPGPGNVDGDPRFGDFLSGDFRLLRGSAAIGAASDGSDMGAVPFDRSRFIRGDANEDDRVGLPDVVAILEALFRNQGLGCESPADVNDDGKLDISDPIRLLFSLFAQGAAIPDPFPACGPDPTPDGLKACGRGCATY